MARLFQDSREKRKLGKKALWSVEWRDKNGRRRSKSIGTKSEAKAFQQHKEIELREERTGLRLDRSWKQFREKYERDILPKMRSGRSREEARTALAHFERIIKPNKVWKIDREMFDEYVAKRLKEPGKKAGDTVSAETVKKELRTIRAALVSAVDWNYLREVPSMPKVESFVTDKPFVTVAHFEAMLGTLGNGSVPRYPRDQHYGPADWWRALLITLWVTGMRISAALDLRWDDVDLDAGVAISRARHNKSKKDKRHRIAAAVETLRVLHRVRMPGEPRVFPWNHDRTTLGNYFGRLQEAAGIQLHCPGNHEHTPACYVYGFHGFRYAHATYNYGRVTDAELQEQMGHASFQTTQRYIKFAREHQERDYDVFLPDSLRVAAKAGG